MITLTQPIDLKGYQVQASLRKREKNHPFIAVLKLAAEQDGWIDADTVHQQLLPALPPKASLNLLERLKAQGYFQLEEVPIAGFASIHNFNPPAPSLDHSTPFQLTDLGWKSADQEEIWTPIEGVFDLQLVKSPFVEQRVVGLEVVSRPIASEKGKSSNQQGPKPQNCPRHLNDLIGTDFQLGKDEYRLEDLEAKCFFLPKETAQLSVQADPKQGVQLTIEASREQQGQKKEEPFLQFHQELPLLTHAHIQDELLFNAFPFRYQSLGNWLEVPFDPNQLSFSRKVNLPEPKLAGETFQPTHLAKVAHQPDSELVAQEWFEKLLHQRLDRYFFSKAELRAFQETLRSQFRSYSPALLSREELLAQLPATSANFYARMKLLAPQLLS